MPVYNAENYVKVAVNSVLAQTFRDLEIVCVNDCSADSSLAVLEELAAADHRVKVIDSAVNVGAGEARNLGIEAAQGEYITFVDADDVIEPDLYDRAIALCENGKIDEVVWGLVEKHYNADDKLTRTVQILPERMTLTNRDKITEEILKLEEATLFGYQWNSIYRAQVIKEYNIKFERVLFYEDYFFNLEFARHIQSLATLDYAGYHYFKRVNSSITHQFTKDYFDLSYRRVNEMYDFCLNRDYKNDNVCNILGNKLLRYTLSALCRNLDSQSEMDHKKRNEWFLSICEKPLYSSLLSRCKVTNPAFGFLKVAISARVSFLALLLGRVVNLVR